jgi:hypothetical protein
MRLPTHKGDQLRLVGLRLGWQVLGFGSLISLLIIRSSKSELISRMSLKITTASRPKLILILCRFTSLVNLGATPAGPYLEPSGPQALCDAFSKLSCLLDHADHEFFAFFRD